MKRREYLTGLAGVGALSAATGQVGADTDARRLGLSSAVGDDTHHPGPPRFGHVGETFYDRLITDVTMDHAGGLDRDSFAPQITGKPQQDPDNYSADDFSWSIVDAPESSSATLEYRPPDETADAEQYDPGQDNVAEFAPDVPGRYVFELDAPDGTHQQILHIFPEDQGDAGPPRISLDGTYDSDAGAFVVESSAHLAPNSSPATNEVAVEWIVDNRDALATDDITISDDSLTATIPENALDGETARLHACPYDGAKAGYSDTVVLDPESKTVENPTHPPEWIEDAIMYEIFPRSFGGPPEEGEWPFENSNANFATMEQRLDYLESLNTDVIWFTPIVPSESANYKPQAYLDGDERTRFKFVGGGPHGYDTLAYTQVAEDLTADYSIQDYYDAPWPWEDGYDPANNAREAARESAMAEFENFVEAAHERDIKICFDLVINHCGRHNAMFQDTIAAKTDTLPEGGVYHNIESYNTDSKYFDWFERRTGQNTTGDGAVADPAPAPTGFAGLRVMPEWNYHNIATREHILAIADELSSKTSIDAFRCDVAYGVPHGFWKEVREVVRQNDSEFMMLDETLPNDPDFAENEFGLHYDTHDFTRNAGHGVAGGSDPMNLYDAIAKRDNEAWPEHSLLLNATENHDEPRLYKLARDGSREDPAKAQRAVWAAGVTLPGVPMIYYGQERLITEYGHQRNDFDGSGEDDRTGDAGPDMYQRAFMNWEDNGDTVPEDHLQFYQDVTQFYRDNEIFHPHADVEKTWFQSEDSVLVFGRSMETDEGTEQVVVMLHFDPGTATVDLLPGAETTDWFTGSDIGVESDGPAVTVEFETLAVVETDTLFSVGELIAEFDESSGDDNGPGSYTYPTGDDYPDGAFDISAATVHTTAEDVQFRFAFDSELTNSAGYDGGITAQHLQIYLQNPEADSGTTEGRAGTNVTFTDPYQYRVVADGQNGARLESHEGEHLADCSLVVNEPADEIVVEVPRAELDTDIQTHYVTPLVFGYDPDAAGGVVPVESESGEAAFGGAETPEMAPRVIDMVVPDSTTQSAALSYTSDALATLPYLSLTSGYEQIGEAVDPEGDDNGPGNYQYPTGPADVHYEGMWDVTSVRVYESLERVRFEYVMATEMQNVWDLNGISQQFVQVYIRDPEAGDGVPTSTDGREGVNTRFAEPYHYRIVVPGYGPIQVENANGSAITTDVNVAVDGDTISFDVPKDAIGGSPTDKQLAALLIPYDGYGTGLVRQNFGEQPGSYQIGTDGEPVETAPRVMDMIPPSDTSQSEALAYTAEETAEIPLAEFQNAYIQTEEQAPITDPEGDDNGPGTYTYPTSDEVPDGCFDVTQVDITASTTTWDVTVHLNGPVTNPWGGGAGFSVQALQLYLQDPSAPADAPRSSSGRTGMTSEFQEGYHYRVVVHGENGPKVVENATGEELATVEASASQENNTISFSVPKAPFQTDDITQMKMAFLVMAKDSYGDGDLRQSFGVEPAQYGFGGVDPDALQTAPRVIDLVGPETVVDQEQALRYGPDSPATIPLYPVANLISGEPPEGSLQAIATPGPTVFAGQSGQLNASNSSDPDGQSLSFQWTQTGGPDASLESTDTSQPTFTAPESVDGETTLEFELTVTDPDGNTATATTTATVRPQSENDAPIAETTESSKTVDPGEIVLLDGAPSEDPNGGTLSFQWEQTGGSPSVELSNADTSGAGFTAPEVDSETTLTFELTVGDGQGKTSTATVEVTVQPADTETSSGSSDDTGSGFGPGFGVVSGALGTAGGAAYAARRLLGEDKPAQPDDVDVDDIEEPADDQ